MRRFCVWVVFVLLLLNVVSLAAATKKEVVLWCVWKDTWPAGKAFKEVIDKFNETHPEISIKRVVIPWREYDKKLMLAILGGNPPDVAIVDRFKFVGWIARKAFLPLDGYFSSEINPSLFYKPALDECSFAGNIYGLPFEVDTRVLIYNKDHFREAGLDPDKPPRNWDELFEYAKKLTKRDSNGKLTQVGFAPFFNNTDDLYLYTLQNGGDWVDESRRKLTLTSEKSVEAIRWVMNFRKWYGDDELDRAKAKFTGAGDLSDPFLRGKVSMVIWGHWELYRIDKLTKEGVIKFDTGVAVPPDNGGNYVSILGGHCAVIPRGSKHADEAWEVVKYLVSKEAQIKFALGCGLIPAVKIAAEAPEFKESAPWMSMVVNTVARSSTRPAIPIASELYDEVWRVYDFAKHGKLDLEKGLKLTEGKLQKKLDGWYKKWGF